MCIVLMSVSVESKTHVRPKLKCLAVQSRKSFAKCENLFQNHGVFEEVTIGVRNFRNGFQMVEFMF